MLKIGLTAGLFYEDPERVVFSPKVLAYVERDMAHFIGGLHHLDDAYKLQALPVLIPPLPQETLPAFLGDLDGLVLQGGTDLAPETYGEKPLDGERWPGDPRRDEYELQILECWVEKIKKPVFGICRGHQLINVFMGGTLYQDLDLELTPHICHRDAEAYDRLTHRVRFAKGGVLAQIFEGKENLMVNTVHHQGIKKLGRSLREEAWADDPDGVNIVEAISGTHQGCELLGVQWHPEFHPTTGDTMHDQRPLYHYFLERIKACKS